MGGGERGQKPSRAKPAEIASHLVTTTEVDIYIIIHKRITINQYMHPMTIRYLAKRPHVLVLLEWRVHTCSVKVLDPKWCVQVWQYECVYFLSDRKSAQKLYAATFWTDRSSSVLSTMYSVQTRIEYYFETKRKLIRNLEIVTQESRPAANIYYSIHLCDKINYFVMYGPKIYYSASGYFILVFEIFDPIKCSIYYRSVHNTKHTK
jgi:hypothetical protein